MIRLLSPVAPLLVGVAILLTGQGLQGTLLPVRANLEGFSTLSIGLMGGAYFFGFTVGCLRGSEWIRRLGHVRVFAAMTTAASAVPLLHGMWPESWLWLLLRFVSGYCFAALYVVIESWLNEASTNENRGTVFSAYIFITLTVEAGGLMMLMLYDPSTMKLFAIASALVSIAALPVIISVGPSPTHTESKVKLDLKRLYIISPAGVLGTLVCGLTAGAFWALAPVFTAAYSSEVSLTAWFMTAAVLGGAAAQYPLGLWSDRVDRRWVIAFTAFAATVTGALMGVLYLDVSRVVLLLLSAAWGAVTFPMYAVVVAHANDFADQSEYVMISSGLLLLYGIGAIVGPFIAPFIMDQVGAGGLYLLAAVVNLLLLSFIILRIVIRSPAPEEEQLPFSDSLASTQTASHIYEDEL